MSSTTWFKDVFGFPEKQRLVLQKIQQRFELATQPADPAVRKCTTAPAVRARARFCAKIILFESSSLSASSSASSPPALTRE